MVSRLFARSAGLIHRKDGDVADTNLPYQVEDDVYVYDGRFTRKVTITKIGRQLVYTSDGGVFRISDQRRHDGYQGSFRTIAEYENNNRRGKALTTLRQTYGIQIEQSTRYPTELLEDLVKLLADRMPTID